MTSISNISKFFLLGLVLLPWCTFAQAEVSQTLSVSPTLFQLEAQPGQAWQSEVRVINVNEYDLTIYPQVVNFAPQGEDGRGDLIPVFSEETQGMTLAEWISVPPEPVTIKAQETATIPMQVQVPTSAAPGGHYAAILIGTKPPTTGENLSQVQTAQFVTSLFFVRVAGDVIEKGDIREFTTSASIVQTPEISLEMRFENTGNVHVQPQGDIKIFNMWGEERGMIPINHQTHFGNVLPDSIRKFTFSWKGDTALYDIGRYKAVATLGYGIGTKQFVTSATYFWVIPYKMLFGTLVVLFVAIKVVLWLIRRYVNRMLALSGVPLDKQPYIPRHARAVSYDKNTVVVQRRYQTVAAPVRAGLKDVLVNWRASTTLPAKFASLLIMLRKYYLVLVAIAAVCVIATVLYLIVVATTAKQTHYEVAITNPGADILLSSEDIAYATKLAANPIPAATRVTPEITIVNASGHVGAGADVRLMLEKDGYKVTTLTTDTKRADEKTSIVYTAKDKELALEISKLLQGALLSARSHDAEDTIVIYAGKDMIVR
jgi:LytR cell envelope-related transcriptional attenuator